MINKFFDINDNDSSETRLSGLQKSLVHILSKKEWTSSEEILESARVSYSTAIKPSTVFRSLRLLREKQYFVFTQRLNRRTRYKICAVDDTPNYHKFFGYTKDDIIKEHKIKNSWNNLI